jgi:exonuclease SbcC
MAVKVRVKNFQSIKDAEIVIDGLTAITGPNNTGKSALLRAVRGAFQNTRGTSFVRYGTDKCSVELDFADGRKLKWEKGDKIKPTYILDGDEDHPLHPGQGVPDEVRDLGVRPIVAGGRDVWPQVAPQLNGQVFLLDEPGSVLAEAVANVDRVGRLNRALKASEKDRRASTSALKVRLSDRDQQEMEVAVYEGLDDVAAEVSAIEAAAHQAERIQKAIKNLRALRDRVVSAREAVVSVQGIRSVGVPDATEVQALLTSLDEMEGLHKRWTGARDRVAQYKGVESITVDIDDAPVEKMAFAIAAVEALRDRIGHQKAVIQSCERALARAESELSEAESDATEILGTFEECPTCGEVVAHTH